MYKKILISFILISITAHAALDKFAVVIVIDGLSYKALQQAKPFLRHGLKQLMEKSTHYTDAHYEYPATSTGPGHSTISTGVWPNIHGIVDNSWYNEYGNKVGCVEDLKKTATIFGVNDFASAENILVDTISDQLLLEPETQCFAISGKDRGAICLAGKMGMPFWLSKTTGAFTSSHAFMNQLPKWLQKFNKGIPSIIRKTAWRAMHPHKHHSYNHCIDMYEHARIEKIIGTSLQLGQDDKKYNRFIFYPESNELILQCAEQVLIHAVEKNTKKLLLWISLSSLDKVSHRFGENSREYVDTIYHLDKQLGDFFKMIDKKIRAQEKLILLMSDHGNMPLPEALPKKFSFARRLSEQNIKETLNRIIEQKMSIKNLIQKIDMPSLFIDTSKLTIYTPEEQQPVFEIIKDELQKIAGVQNVWTGHELPAITGSDRLSTFIKNNYYAGRSGPVQYVLQPYHIMSKYAGGTMHASPYNYTTHVPLMIQTTKKEPHEFSQAVSMTQVAPTIAEFFGCAKPSACSAQSLGWHKD